MVYDLVKPFMGTANRFSGLVVPNRGLLRFYAGECVALTTIEVCFLAVSLTGNIVNN